VSVRGFLTVDESDDSRFQVGKTYHVRLYADRSYDIANQQAAPTPPPPEPVPTEAPAVAPVGAPSVPLTVSEAAAAVEPIPGEVVAQDAPDGTVGTA
jgi:hypothetical protein